MSDSQGASEKCSHIARWFLVLCGPMKKPNTIGDNLARLEAEIGKKGPEIADLLHVTRGFWWDMVTGRRKPGLDTLQAIASMFTKELKREVTLGELVMPPAAVAPAAPIAPPAKKRGRPPKAAKAVVKASPAARAMTVFGKRKRGRPRKS